MGLPFRNKLLILFLTLTSTRSQYIDDGYFDPRTTHPHHLYSPAERKDHEFTHIMNKHTPHQPATDGEIHRTLANDPYIPDDYESISSQPECTLDGSPTGSNYCCTNCVGLQKCKMLNNRLIEDRYGRLKGTDDSCLNFESRAERLDIFGPSKTFVDTDECRTMAYDYTCLWWGSSNTVYTNNCNSQTLELTDGNLVSTALQPCLSYCTQLANMCANNFDWIRLCRGVLCDDDFGESCTPGPSEVLRGGCKDYKIELFYSAENKRLNASIWENVFLTLLLMILLFV